MSLSSLQIFKLACEATDNYVCYHIPIPAVIGIVFGCAFLLLTGIFITFLCVKHRRHKRRMREEGEAAGESVLGYNGAKRGERMEFNPDAY
jgi:hypothetical protein